VRRGSRFPNDQAEVVFADIIVEQLERFSEDGRIEVLAEIVHLCGDPAGKHPLHAALSGWNTLDVLGGHYRVVYKATISQGVGLLEILCIGPRSDSEVYDMADHRGPPGRPLWRLDGPGKVQLRAPGCAPPARIGRPR
jgi:hypothetical protein